MAVGVSARVGGGAAAGAVALGGCKGSMKGCPAPALSASGLHPFYQQLPFSAFLRCDPSGGVQLLHHSGQSAARWGPLDDVVMGGVSSSGIALEAGAGEDGAGAWVFR